MAYGLLDSEYLYTASSWYVVLYSVLKVFILLATLLEPKGSALCEFYIFIWTADHLFNFLLFFRTMPRKINHGLDYDEAYDDYEDYDYDYEIEDNGWWLS